MNTHSSTATTEEMVTQAMYLICKGGAYYRPNAEGYTRNRSKAGRYTLAEAVFHSHPNGVHGPRDGVTYEPADDTPTDSAGVPDGLVERLRALMAEASPQPWVYRPNKHDDWGWIRGVEKDSAIGRYRPIVANGKDSDADDAAHRAAGTDPYGPNAKLIVEAVNALPVLIAALSARPSPPKVDATIPVMPDEPFDPKRLGENVQATLAMRGQTYREAAPIVGISTATLNRIARGNMPDVPSYLAVMRWLNIPLASTQRGAEEVVRLREALASVASDCQLAQDALGNSPKEFDSVRAAFGIVADRAKAAALQGEGSTS